MFRIQYNTIDKTFNFYVNEVMRIKFITYIMAWYSTCLKKSTYIDTLLHKNSQKILRIKFRI